MIDRERRTVTIDGKAMRPTRRVFDLVAVLAARPGVVFTRHQIMDALGISENNFDRTIDTTVKHARKQGITQIATSWGIGYFWSGESPMAKLSINDLIRAKLTPRGHEVHRAFWEPRLALKGAPYTPMPVDAEGYSRFTVWQWLMIFGASVMDGGAMPFEGDMLTERLPVIREPGARA